MEQLNFGLVAAVNEGRLSDALEIAQTLIDEHEDGARGAVLELAVVAGYLHRTPGTPLSLSAAMWQSEEAGYTLTSEGLTGASVSLELIDVIEEMLQLSEEDDEPDPDAEELPLSDTARAFLAQFDMRPGSADLMEQACRIAVLMVSTMGLQYGLRMQQRRTSNGAIRHSLAFARAAVTNSETPDLFDEAWDDET